MGRRRLVNPWSLTASELLVWGITLHLIADWPLQNDWMANNKADLRKSAGYVHAGIHGLLLSLVFGWAAIPLAIVHLIIDTRKPVVWWSKLVKQTQPANRSFYQRPNSIRGVEEIPVYDVGLEVRFWTDQVFHIACIAAAAVLVTL